jgi:hypothetical protein
MLGAALAAFTALATAARAELIAYEGFDYAEEMPIHGAAGGTGWLTTRLAEAENVGWAVQRMNTAAGGYRVLTSPAFSHPGVTASPGHLVGGWDFLSVGRTLEVRGAPGKTPSWSDGVLAGKPGQPIYIAALMRVDATTSGSVFLNVHANRFASQVDRNRVSWGAFGRAGAISHWGLRGSDGEVLRTDVPVVPGEAVWLLVKLEFTVVAAKFAGQASLWVNPRPARVGASGVITLPPPSVGLETDDLRFHSLAAYLGSGPGGGALDEVRVGTSLEAVLSGLR